MNNNKIDEIINSVSGIKPATPKPFLATRVMAKLHTKKENWWEKAMQTISQPAMAAGIIGAIILVNVLALTSTTNNTNATEADDVAVNSSYGFTTTDLDWIENK